MSEGIVLHHVDGSIRAANAAAERVLGLTVEQMSGRAATDPRWQLIRPDGLPLGPDDIPSEIARKTGKPVSDRILGVHRPTGELAWLNVRAGPLREAGDPTLRGVIATFTDVTREREAQLALERSQAQSQRVLDAVPGAVFQYLQPPIGPGRLAYFAGRSRELLGRDTEPTRVPSDDLLALLTPEARAALPGQIAAAVAARGVFDQELAYNHPTRGLCWVRVRGVPEDTAEGMLYTGVLLDITEARRLAEALHRAERRDSMAQMAAGVAHNFNNMLAAILPNLELARRDATPGQQALLADAERAAQSAADLVRRMLTLGRRDPSAGDVTDLAAVVREVLHLCRGTFDRGITIEERIELPVAPVRAPQPDLEQVVLNLCFNARDAMEGIEHRRLTLTLAPEGEGSVRLLVTDTGRGMSEATLRRIGEPFFSTKPPGRGTGLGLASAFHAVHEAGGSWRVASTPGAGTSFTIVLPLTAAAAAPRRRPTPAGSVMVRGTVLLVDDEEIVRRAVSRMLQPAGYRVLAAAGAEEALGWAQGAEAAAIDAVLLDLSMPGTSGQQLLPQLRRLLPAAPVLVLSGHVADPAQLTEAAEVLQKPIVARELVAAITRARGQAPG